MALVAPDTVAPFTDHWYCGAAPPLVAKDVTFTVLPAHNVVPGLAVMFIIGVTDGIIVIVALPAMLSAQLVVLLVAVTVYTPAAVSRPKSSAWPVPAIAAPVSVLPSYN